MAVKNRKLFPVLYKMDSKGKIRQWKIEAIEYNVPKYVQEHGLQDGKLQTTSTIVDKGKNIGKTNETTPWEQCELEAESLWNKQRDRKGYSETIPTEKPRLPMLAHKYSEHAKKIKWPCYAQPKLDGIRCMAKIVDGKVVSLKSRTNTEFKVLDHIKVALEQSSLGTITLDGELYNHKLRDEFGKIVSAIKRDDPNVDSSVIQYHIYDAFLMIDYEDRQEFIKEYVAENESIVVVETKEIKDEEAFQKLYSKYMEAGYEGGILRNKKGGYKENSRSHDLLKYKDFDDSEFEIVGAEECKGKQADMCKFWCVTREGYRFKVMPRGTEEQRKKYWRDFQRGKLTGKFLTVRYFGFTDTDEPVPRIGIGIAIRDYE